MATTTTTTVTVLVADSAEQSPFSLFELHKAETPTVLVYLYSSLTFLNRPEFQQSRTIMSSIFQHGHVVKSARNRDSVRAAIVGSAVNFLHSSTLIASNTGGFVLQATLDINQGVHIILCDAGSVKQAVEAAHADTPCCLCVFTGTLADDNATVQLLEHTGFVPVINLADEDDTDEESASGCGLFFLKPAPHFCQVKCLSSTSYVLTFT